MKFTKNDRSAIKNYVYRAFQWGQNETKFCFESAWIKIVHQKYKPTKRKRRYSDEERYSDEYIEGNKAILKRRFGGCRLGFSRCDIFDGFDRFSRFDGFNGFHGFGVFSGFNRLSEFSRFTEFDVFDGFVF